MSKRNIQDLKDLLIYVILPTTGLILFFYVMIAEIVFSFRHPWATETEKFIHIGDALKFKSIPYKEMRQ